MIWPLSGRKTNGIASEVEPPTKGASTHSETRKIFEQDRKPQQDSIRAEFCQMTMRGSSNVTAFASATNSIIIKRRHAGILYHMVDGDGTDCVIIHWCYILYTPETIGDIPLLKYSKIKAIYRRDGRLKIRWEVTVSRPPELWPKIVSLLHLQEKRVLWLIKFLIYANSINSNLTLYLSIQELSVIWSNHKIFWFEILGILYFTK